MLIRPRPFTFRQKPSLRHRAALCGMCPLSCKEVGAGGLSLQALATNPSCACGTPYTICRKIVKSWEGEGTFGGAIKICIAKGIGKRLRPNMRRGTCTWGLAAPLRAGGTA
eukprot:11281592-Karenia_brevis.AAC.1